MFLNDHLIVLNMVWEIDIAPSYQEPWEQAFSYFEKKSSRLKPRIQEAMAHGQSRAPINHEIFVHIQFPRCKYAQNMLIRNMLINRGDYEQIVEQYSTQITDAFENSQNPVFINDKEEKNMLAEIVPVPSDKEIYSYNDLFPTGSLDKKGLERLLGLLNGINAEDSFRIHGAQLGCCLNSFAWQLLGAVYFSQYWPPVTSVDKLFRTKIIKMHYVLYNVISKDRIAQKTNIRFGVMFDALGLAQKMITEPPGFTLQLCDRATEVIPLSEEYRDQLSAAIAYEGGFKSLVHKKTIS